MGRNVIIAMVFMPAILNYMMMNEVVKEMKGQQQYSDILRVSLK